MAARLGTDRTAANAEACAAWLGLIAPGVPVQQALYIRCNRCCRFLDLSLMALRTSCFLCGTSCCRSCAAGGLWCAHPCHIGSTTRARYRRICTGAEPGARPCRICSGPIRMGGSALWYRRGLSTRCCGRSRTRALTASCTSGVRTAAAVASNQHASAVHLGNMAHPAVVRNGRHWPLRCAF